MSEQKKTPETTIATLDMEGSGVLTLTNKHLRGQVVRVLAQGNMKLQQKEQIDVLLSAIAGYSVIDIPLKWLRIMVASTIALILAGTWAFYGFLGDILEMNISIPLVLSVVLIAIGIISWKSIKDSAVFELNIMGGKFHIPVKTRLADKVREFITKLQEAKTEYEERNA